MQLNYFAQRRQELDLTQRQIAERLGMTPQAVSAWESGESLPRHAILEQVAAAYEVDPAELFAKVIELARKPAATV